MSNPLTKTLGAVTIASAKLVKFVTYVGMAAAGLALAFAGLQLVLPTGAEMDILLKPGLFFGSALAGWHAADWVEGALRDNPQAQGAQAQRLKALAGAQRG